MADAGENHQEVLEFYEDSPCGYVLTLGSGRVMRTNRTFRRMARLGEGVPVEKFQELFTVGARIYYETHLRPLLTVEGTVSQVALELRRGEEGPLPVLVNAKVVAAEADAEMTVAWAVMDASDRRNYERELLAGRKRAEEAEKVASELNARLGAANEELQKTLTDLRESTLYIRKLEGILPICMRCKSVRSDDDSEWLELDRYLMQTGAVALSHSVCPTCLESFEAS